MIISTRTLHNSLAHNKLSSTGLGNYSHRTQAELNVGRAGPD